MTITDNAVKHLRVLLAERSEGSDTDGLRIYIENGGCSGMQYGMTIDGVKNDDEVVEKEGVRVLIDPASIGFLHGSTIDYCDDLTGTGFRIENPNARRTCGCGTSFEPASAPTEAAATAAS